ncbi:MAG: MaoC family dehydratase [Rudaea sp.]|uniref:MaoC family dehydratase n=1 Tax=Rudaea sp. TaxID=2136325 RepID=UPI0039E30586
MAASAGLPNHLPPRERFFEDFAVGEVFEFGDRVVDETEIVEFARKYDPQPFHTDPVAALDSSFGGLCASGWHTAAVVMRMFVDEFIAPASAMGSPGVDELRWVRPVRPGDRLRVSLRVLETRRSNSKPDRGILKLRYDTLNQHGEIVMSITSRAMLRSRHSTNHER